MTAATASPHTDPAEIARFAAQAAEWWNPHGPMAALHRINPVRIGYIRDRLCAQFGSDPKQAKPLLGLAIADIGCGAGLLCEPLARLGATVTGVDAAPENITAATAHAAGMELAIRYRCATAEELAGETFDAVLAMEIIEHVPDPAAFTGAVAALVKPGGVLIASTLNRTPKSLALGVVAAEYLLRWVPRGTHDWRKFVKPSEFARDLRASGMTVNEVTGISFEAATGTFALSGDVEVNYLLTATKA